MAIYDRFSNLEEIKLLVSVKVTGIWFFLVFLKNNNECEIIVELRQDNLDLRIVFRRLD